MQYTLSYIFLIFNIFFNVSKASTDNNTSTYNSTLPKLVFAHYLLGTGTITEEHAHQDIDDAVSLGIDGFALNLGNPTRETTNKTIALLFEYAATTSFKLFFSIDLASADIQCKELTDFLPLLQQYVQHPAHLLVEDAPFISTFNDGSLTSSNWTNFLSTVANKTYFVPDFDKTDGYYESTTGWWKYWGDVVDGLFSWESNWMEYPDDGYGSAFPGDVGLDQIVMDGAVAKNKSYMIGLSAVQYKDSYNGNWYREGGLNFPIRMENILSMSPSPAFTEIITWNDGPESHYIGNVWSEATTDYYDLERSGPWKSYSSDNWTHTSWQPIYASFIQAFKAELPATEMTTPEGTTDIAVGALWYKTILQDTICSNYTYNETLNPWYWVKNDTTCPQKLAPDEYYYPKPQNFENGTDAHNWAIVLSSNTSDSAYKLRAYSNDVVIGNTTLSPGLNYGSFDGIQAGTQRMEVLDSSGNVVMKTEIGLRGVSEECTDNVYNMNYEVVGLKAAKSLGCISSIMPKWGLITIIPFLFLIW